MSELIPIRRFNFEVNARFARKALSDNGIDATINEIGGLNDKQYELRVKPDILHQAQIEINKLELDDKPVHKDSEGYLEGTTEWMNHMYNPTYYLGGKTPRYYFDRTNWKFFATLFLIVGLFMLIAILSDGSGKLNYETILYSVLYIFVGSSLIWQLYKKRK